MDNTYLGKITSTHGIKGEIKIKSSFPYLDKAFKVGTKIVIDNNSYKINSYRRHKNLEMITLEGYADINEVLFLIKKDVYKTKQELELEQEELLDEELITYKILTTDEKRGIIKEIFFASNENKILRVVIADKEILVPYTKPFIKSINYDTKEILVELIEGM